MIWIALPATPPKAGGSPGRLARRDSITTAPDFRCAARMSRRRAAAATPPRASRQRPCEGCHRDPHAGRNDGTCAECHTAVAWSDTRTLDQHRRTRMPLTGRHATVDCAACHKRQSERTYSDTPTDCYSCHRDDYRNADPQIHHLGENNGPFTRECGACHRTSGWKPAFAVPTARVASALSSADHDAFFTLSTGSHRALDCASCHVDARRTKSVRCDACHTSATLRSQHAQPVPLDGNRDACAVIHEERPMRAGARRHACSSPAARSQQPIRCPSR